MQKIEDLKLFNGELPYGNIERSFTIKPDINPYCIYKTLKDIFGKPNNNYTDDDKIKWSFSFKYNDFYIVIYDWKELSTNIAVNGDEGKTKDAENLAKKIKQKLEKEASSFKKELKKKLNNPDAKIIQNPFKLYYSTAENLRELAKDVIVKSNDIEDLQDSFDIFVKQFDISRSAFLMYLSSFEAFLNLVYEMNLKNEHRDERIYGTINRHQIDVKLRMAPTYCDGFKVNYIDREDERFKNYLRIVNLRNDFVHANLIKSRENKVIKEDGIDFVFFKQEDLTIPKDFGEISLDNVDTAKKYIDEVIQLVLESMKQNYRKNFKQILDFEAIQIDKDIE